jgi:hypothetical protein
VYDAPQTVREERLEQIRSYRDRISPDTPAYLFKDSRKDFNKNRMMRPVIFTTGAFLEPIKLTSENGKEYWTWAVSEFMDESFKDGEIYNPKETAGSLEMLLTK